VRSQHSDTWEAVEAEAERLIVEHTATLDAEAVLQSREFLRFIRGRTPVPEVGAGYWRRSLRVTWPDLEVEVFDNRLEVYRFPDRKVDIRYFARVPGEPFAADVVTELESLQA
jgi:hypothetical protein